MTAATPSPAGPVLPLLAKKLRKLAKDVLKLKISDFRNPEKLLADKDEIAASLEQIAAMCDGTATRTGPTG
jgi:hypothetical protein